MYIFFNVWTAAGVLVSFAAALIVIANNPRAILNRLFFGFAMAIAALNSLELLMRLTDSPAKALAYFNLHVVAWFCFVAFLTHFAIVLARREEDLTRWLGYLPLYGPIPVVGWLNWQTNWFYLGVTKQAMGFTQKFGEYYWILSLYSILLFLALICYAGLAWWQAKNEREKKQNRIIFFGFVATFLPTLLIEVLSGPLGLVLPPLIVQMSTIIVVFFAYSMIRYGLLLITPADLATDVLAIIPDLLLYADNYQRVAIVNGELAKRFGQERDALIGRDCRTLFEDEREYQALLGEVAREQRLSPRLTKLRTANGTVLMVEVSGALVKDRFGEQGGVLYIFRDVTERERLLAEQKRMIEEMTRVEQQMKGQIEERALFFKTTMDREDKIIELKKKNEALEKEIARLKKT
ncbi:MAG: PAS domain S-box protein [Syntrophales bacterium]